MGTYLFLAKGAPMEHYQSGLFVFGVKFVFIINVRYMSVNIVRNVSRVPATKIVFDNILGAQTKC